MNLSTNDLSIMLWLMQNNTLLKKHFSQICLSVFQPFSLICSPLLSMLCGRNKWIIHYLIVIFLSFGNAGLRLDAHHVCWRNWDLVTTSFRILHPVNPSLSLSRHWYNPSLSLFFFPTLMFLFRLCLSLSPSVVHCPDKVWCGQTRASCPLRTPMGR